MSVTYRRFAGLAAYLVAIGGVTYSILFVIAVKGGSRAADTGGWTLLLIGGILSTAVLVACTSSSARPTPGSRCGVCSWGSSERPDR
jgi:hypothetical protein